MPVDFPKKLGRPREYGFRSLEGFADERVGLAAAALDELRARVIDQVEDLPEAALRFSPGGTSLTIGALAAHLVWAEAGWIERIARTTAPGTLAPPGLRAAVDPAGAALPRGDDVNPDLDADAIVSLCHEVRNRLTIRVLQPLPSIDLRLLDEDRPMTARAVLMHLVWHWTYHSAHIGLIREQWGSGYSWRFGSMA